MQKQILVVEDSEINCAILCGILSDHYQVMEANNGQEALDILRQHKDSIALILLDVMMPVMDGYTFLDRIREDAELSLIPVIVTTQSDSEDSEISALAHGATDFVPKPYRPQVILHRVASLIKLRETAAMVNQFQYDRLTGLYSKEFFYQKVRERLAQNPEQEYCIVCSNIENFKFFNDIFGVQAGDRLLKEAAHIAQRMMGSSGFCGRFSGDRFLFFQTRQQEQKDRENFGKLSDDALSPILKRVVIRWGIYEVTDPSIPVEQMCDRAMLAANSIKGQYHQFFAVYDDSLRNRLLREQNITAAMDSALTEEQFVVYYQPKYSLNEDLIAGAEALVRWNHPEWGFMSPGEFIPLFEKNGFIHLLDQYVWEKVCVQLQDWQNRGFEPLPVSVNVSRSDVFQDNVADTLLSLTEKYGIDPSWLHLEITESAYTQKTDHLVQTVDELRSLGFIVEMDDFGSGYSSLNMLSEMSLDILKLDMKFVRNEIEKPSTQSILSDVISMAHRMHLSVVAEGVETEEQVHRLRAVGCDYVQGYYFAKPMPAAEFEELRRKQPSHLSAASLKIPEAHRDPLTGLLNWHGLRAAITEFRREDLPLAVYLFDLDNLKNTSEAGDRQIEDRIICAFADLLHCSTRRSDLLCRCGGAEFLVILRGLGEVDKAVKKGEEICEAFRASFKDEEFPAFCSVGIALSGTERMPSVELIDEAYQALDRAKQEHRSNCCLWKES